jgi:hypothetical protein
MDYKKFYIAVRRYAKGRISRGAFLIDWEYAQNSQGIKAAEQRGVKHGGKVK